MFKANDSEESPFTQVRPSSKYSAASVQPCEPDVDDNSHVNGEYANVNWDELRFDLTPTDYMYIMKCSKEDFSPGTLTPLGNMEMSPSSGILNYSQGVLEGMKAYRTEDGRILLFRPELNALRMKMGAERLCMPSPTVDQFLDAVKQTVNANKRWVANTFNPADYFYFPIFLSLNCNKFISGYGEKVPPPGKGSMYIRPLLIGSGSMLNLGTANEHTFLTYVSPVGNFHKGMVNLVVAENVYRATPGGTGGIKAICNYAAIYRTISEAKAKGFSDVLFLDVVTGKRIEEASTSNIFIVKGNIISTPATQGTILPGITRKSIIEIARVLGYQVEERDILVEELFDAEEVFCTGTAVVVNFVNSITYQSRRVEYRTGVETVSQKLYATLTGIQTGRIEDKMGWTVQLD